MQVHYCFGVTQYEWHVQHEWRAQARVEIPRDSVIVDVDAPTRAAVCKTVNAALINVCARWRSPTAARTTFRCGDANVYYVIVFVGDSAPTVALYTDFADAYAASTEEPA